MDVASLARVRELEAENSKLKRMYADQALDIHALKGVIAKKRPWDHYGALGGAGSGGR